MRRNPGVALKVSFKLAVQRLRSSTAKKEAQNKVARREIASLLEKGKEETARVVRVLLKRRLLYHASAQQLMTMVSYLGFG